MFNTIKFVECWCTPWLTRNSLFHYEIVTQEHKHLWFLHIYTFVQRECTFLPLATDLPLEIHYPRQHTEPIPFCDKVQLLCISLSAKTLQRGFTAALPISNFPRTYFCLAVLKHGQYKPVFLFSPSHIKKNKLELCSGQQSYIHAAGSRQQLGPAQKIPCGSEYQHQSPFASFAAIVNGRPLTQIGSLTSLVRLKVGIFIVLSFPSIVYWRAGWGSECGLMLKLIY